MSATTSSSIFLQKFHLTQYKKSLKHFLTYEFLFLTKNTSFNPKKFKKNTKLNLISIENYSKFPKIFTRSIFRALDSKNTNNISLKDYIKGYFKIYSGTIEERLSFIFYMFDLNNDQYIYKKDLHIILNYTHFFANKKNKDILTNIIEDFFEQKSSFNLEKFIHRVTTKSSGLFFVIICFLFEFRNFNEDILKLLNDNKLNKSIIKDKSILEKEEKPNKLKKDGTSTKNSSLEKIEDLVPPSDQAIEYILLNFKYDLNFLKKNSKDREGNPLKNSFDSSISDHLECEEDIKELNYFENDILLAKEMYIENAFVLEPEEEPNSLKRVKTTFIKDGPRGSEFCENIRKSSINTVRSFKFYAPKKGVSFQRGFQTYKVSRKRGPKSIDRCRTQSNLEIKKSKYNNPTLSTSRPSFGDYSMTSIEKASLEDNLFTEEILFIKEDKTQKKYFLSLSNGFILLTKKKLGNNLNDDESSEDNKIKRFIPLRHLYIFEVEDNILVNQKVYSKINFVSTIFLNNEEFIFLFENKIRLEEFISLISKQNKSVSFQKEYTFIQDIDKGGFCQIKLYKENSTQELYAVKKLKKNAETFEEFQTLQWEKDIVRFLINFPEIDNIIKFYQIIESAEHIYIIMEYVETGSLGAFLGKIRDRLSSVVVKDILTQTVKGVKILHSYGIIHRDLKLENLLIKFANPKVPNFSQKIQIKLIDFGYSFVSTPQLTNREKYGTLFYCPPEVLLKKSYNNKIDTWSCGIMAFYLEYGMMPFGLKGVEKENDVIRMIVINKLIIPKRNPDKKDGDPNEENKAKLIIEKFIKVCLTKDIRKRPVMEEVYTLLTKEEEKK